MIEYEVREAAKQALDQIGQRGLELGSEISLAQKPDEWEILFWIGSFNPRLRVMLPDRESASWRIENLLRTELPAWKKRAFSL